MPQTGESQVSAPCCHVRSSSNALDFQIERIETFREPQRADPKPLLTAEVRDLSG